ncbi:MAG: hypothetical protein M3Q13_01065 [Pseudomonadota bacterium]|nr:hypothetical protein [Pseudomonadota bacterium]
MRIEEWGQAHLVLAKQTSSRVSTKAKINSFRLTAGHFCFGKSNQNHRRRTRAACGGALRSSVDAARRPNSLRSNMGASTAAPPCGARRALRRRQITNEATAKKLRKA